MSLSILERAVRAYGHERFLEALPEHLRGRLPFEWTAWARPEQLEPGTPGAASQRTDWRVSLALAGRGWGKSRHGAETVRGWALRYPGCHIALVGRTAADVRDVMVRAILTAWRGGQIDPIGMPVATPSTRSLRWSNGSHATTYSAEEPRQMLGQNHDFAWCDELAAWPSSKSTRAETGARSVMEEVWHEGVMMSLRGSGEAVIDRPRALVTTTPRPKKLIRELLRETSTVITRGSTYDNATNLPVEYVEMLRTRYEGTRIGKQEIHAEMLDDITGALWTYDMIDDHRVEADKLPDMVRVVVGVDPSGKSEDGDEQGIVVAGKGTDGHCYVLADRSTHDTPDGWGRRTVQAYIDHKADAVLVERNYGGDMVAHTVTAAAQAMGVRVTVKEVTATRGKVVRAEPVSALYEQGKVHHVGDLAELEEQLREYVPQSGRSPDRMDALVWAITDLMLGDPPASFSAGTFKAPRRSF